MLSSWLHRLAHCLGLEDERSNPVTVTVVKEVFVEKDKETEKPGEHQADKEAMDKMLVEINITLSILKRDVELLTGEHPDNGH